MEIKTSIKTITDHVVGDSTRVLFTKSDGSKIFCDQKYISLHGSHTTSLSKGYIRVGCNSISIEDAQKAMLYLRNEFSPKMVKTYFNRATNKAIVSTFVEESPKFYIFKSRDNSHKAFLKSRVEVRDVPESLKISIRGNRVYYSKERTFLHSTPKEVADKIELLIKLHNFMYE